MSERNHRGITLIRPKTNGFAACTEDDERRFCSHWKLGTRERVAFTVLRETDLRRGDAVRVGRPHARDGVIKFATKNTGERGKISLERNLALFPAQETAASS
jgi:hypothetical protein